MAVLDNKIDSSQMFALLEGGRKVHYRHVLDGAVSNSVAFAASQSKKPSQVLERGLKEFRKAAS